MLRCLILAVCLLPLFAEAPPTPQLTPGPDDTIQYDDWLNGFLNGQPLANMHVVTVVHADGTRSTVSDSTIIMSRQLGLFGSKFSMKETSLFREDAEGYLSAFELHQDENGARTVAVGTVGDGELDVTIHRAGLERSQTIPIPEGIRLMGMEASQRAMNEAGLAEGESMDFHSVALMSGQVRLVTVTATLMKSYTVGGGKYKLVIDLVPFMPMYAVIDGDNNVKHLRISFGPIQIDFKEGEGPQKLEGAQLAMVGMMDMQGPPPKSADVNRYRLPEQALKDIPVGDFQELDGDVLTVHSTAVAGPLEDPAPYLAAEPMLEINEAELQEWTAKILEGAPEDVPGRTAHIVRAVRSHLTGDLSRGEASALEALREKKGDCTEHANLVTAACRIAGIPSRVDVGFVYAAGFGGWGGHAWSAAYDEAQQRWIHLDAAYPGVARSCYIRTGSSSNTAEGGTNAMLDRGMGLVMGQSIEVLPPVAEEAARD